jgi:hypothetical protein
MIILSVLGHNQINEAARQHNRSKLFNECVAHSQLAYLPYYFGLLSSFELSAWFTTILFLIVWSLLAFYVGVVYFVKGQERIIKFRVMSARRETTNRIQPASFRGLLWKSFVSGM